jgi:hypothetical protein
VCAPPDQKVQMSADGETDSSQRCKEDPEVTKAVPDPVPDFFSPEEESEQSLDKYGANNHASLPVRKTKGGSEKRRDTTVEMMFTPMGKAMDPDEPEDIVQMKADLGKKAKQEILSPSSPLPLSPTNKHANTKTQKKNTNTQGRIYNP